MILRNAYSFDASISSLSIENCSPLSVLEAESRLGSKHERFVSLVKADEDQKKKLAEEKALEKWRQLDEALGFTAVIKALADSQKIIIGEKECVDALYTKLGITFLIGKLRNSLNSSRHELIFEKCSYLT